MSTKEKVEIAIKERPYALEAIKTQVLYDIASMLEDQGKTLIDFFESWRGTVPKGELRPLRLAITDRITELDPGNTPGMPWFTFDIFVDGPDPVFLGVNVDFIRERSPLRAGEHLKVDVGKANINKVLLHCEQEKKSTVRIFGKS